MRLALLTVTRHYGRQRMQCLQSGPEPKDDHPNMTHRRVRYRTRVAQSALSDMPVTTSPQRHLNDATADVTRCAWPRCRQPMQTPLPDGMPPAQTRYGVLCDVHALDVAVAVIQHQTDQQRFLQVFERMSDEKAIRLEEWRREDEQYEADKASLRQDRAGFVYYLRIGERIKVGYSVDVKRRMRAYPPGSQLLAVEPGDRELERQRHHQFAGSRTDGREWFRPTPDIDELIEQLVQQHGDPKRFAHHYRKTDQPMRLSRSA